MTLFEVGVVIAIVVVLAAVFLPSLRDRQGKTQQIVCVNQLKQIGLCYRIWEGDNGDIFPMGISVTNGGSMEMAQTGNVVQTFVVMSNELSVARILYCPADENKYLAGNFSGLSNSNISYFVDVDVTNDTDPRKIISGDCNFEVRGLPVKSGLGLFWTNIPVSWATNRHDTIGNLGFADGSVLTTTLANLQTDLHLTRFATNRFAIP